MNRVLALVALMSLVAAARAAGPEEQAGPAAAPSAPRVVAPLTAPLAPTLSSGDNGLPTPLAATPSAIQPLAKTFPSPIAKPSVAAPGPLRASAVAPAQAAPAEGGADAKREDFNGYARPDGTAVLFQAPDAASPGPNAHEEAYQGRIAPPRALKQLRAELADLQRQLKDAKAEGRGASVEAAIRDKKTEMASASVLRKAHYDALRVEASRLKGERDRARARAAATGLERLKYRGVGEDEQREVAQEQKLIAAGHARQARVMALERAAALDAQLAARKQDIALIERDDPGAAGFRAPLVAARNVLGLSAKTPAEKKLSDEIASLEKERRGLETGAARILLGQKDAPSAEAVAAATDMKRRAAELGKTIDAKKARLAAHPIARTLSPKEVGLASEIAEMDAEQKRLDATALRLLAGQRDNPSGSAVETAQAAQARAQDLRAQVELKRRELRGLR